MYPQQYLQASPLSSWRAMAACVLGTNVKRLFTVVMAVVIVLVLAVFGRGRISDDEVCGALMVRGAAKVHLHLQIVKSDSTMVSDCDFWLSWLTLNY